MSIKASLIQWYRTNKRDLPWRQNKNAYSIWLSEIILQQTRVEQGRPYYEKFMQHFPEVCDLAKASEDEVLKLWQGLGYYSRARNLQKAAKLVCNKENGRFPETYVSLLQLPGVGPYTAAAIASIAFEEPVAVVDGNVYRFLSRLYGIDTPINSSKAHQEFKSIAEDLMEGEGAGEFNQALMEMGALQCTPVKPLCETCPVAQFCFANKHQKQDNFPVKIQKTKVKEVFYNFIDLRYEDKMYLEKRDESSIWKGLYQFPLIESKSQLKAEEILNLIDHELGLGLKDFQQVHDKMKLTHLLSHRKIQAKFWQVKVKKAPQITKNNIFEIRQEDLVKYPVPRLIDKYFERFNYVSK